MSGGRNGKSLVAEPARRFRGEKANGMPWSPDAERGVLGCLLLDAVRCLPEVREWFADLDVFYDGRHQRVYEAIVRLDEMRQAVDVLTVAAFLRDSGDLDRVGGEAFLSGLIEEVASPALLPTYVQEVYRHYQLRLAAERFQRLSQEARQVPDDVEGWLAHAEEQVFQLPRTKQNGIRSAGVLVQEMLKQVERYHRGTGHITGLATGFAYWDKLTGGLQPGEVYVIGGRPGSGKTSLAMNVAERVALWDTPEGVRQGRPVGILSLEMGASDLMLRLWCSRARVNLQKMRTGMLSDRDRDRLARVFPDMERLPLYIDDTPSMTAVEMRSKLRQMKARYGIELAVVDYLQLARLPREFAGDRVGGIAQVSAALLASAKELNVPVLLVSQLSREVERRSGTPTMADLRDSGAIEQDAHFVGILYREKLTEEQEEALREKIARDPTGETEYPVRMEICKNRNGPSGTAMRLRFLRWCLRLEDEQRPTRAPDDEPMLELMEGL